MDNFDYGCLLLDGAMSMLATVRGVALYRALYCNAMAGMSRHFVPGQEIAVNLLYRCRFTKTSFRAFFTHFVVHSSEPFVGGLATAFTIRNIAGPTALQPAREGPAQSAGSDQYNADAYRKTWLSMEFSLLDITLRRQRRRAGTVKLGYAVVNIIRPFCRTHRCVPKKRKGRMLWNSSPDYCDASCELVASMSLKWEALAEVPPAALGTLR